MKSNTIPNLLAIAAAGALIGSGAGCSMWHIGTAKKMVEIDASPGATNKGYVEFYSLEHNFPFPIFMVDDQGKPILLGSIGLEPGDWYSYDRNGRIVAKKLQVAMPAGTYQFMIERNGPRLQVPVKEGKLTPVELDYHKQDQAMNYVTYRLDSRVFPPGPMALQTKATKKP